MKNYSILFLFLLFGAIALQSCKEEEPNCNTLFGNPVSNTGLTASECKAVCECKNFTSKAFTPNELASLRAYTLTQPFEELTSNPYDNPVPPSTSQVCAVVIEDQSAKTYHLETFNSEAEAEAAGAILTHHDACALCSSLEDFAVYAENLDVGADVRSCAIANFGQPFDSLVVCIQSIGFTLPCAQIWAYNTLNTREECFDVCINNNTYNNADGTLSECLQCDEEKSGPIFKVFAGRTRRNTGIASSICRFCEEVQVVEHNYPL